MNCGTVPACGERRDSISTIKRERAARKNNIKNFAFMMQAMIAREEGHASSSSGAPERTLERDL